MRTLLTLALLAASPTSQDTAAGPWSEPARAALERAGENRAELEHALAEVPVAQRDSLEFLVAHMPARDLESLPAERLLEDVALAHGARAAAPWGPELSDELFWNDVLPYASLTETREAWRPAMHADYRPLIEGAEGPAEAAHLLNQEIFARLGVRYSRDRKRADQAPSESIESGVASCTGLSILLVDACRAVGVPARIAGTARWADGSGNHTWVEVWDDGWHFVGAAEPDGRGVDHAWFTGRAAKAIAGGEHAIWASSFRPTGDLFPLVWAPRQDYVHAVDVTAQYAQDQPPEDRLDGVRAVAAGYFAASAEERAHWTFDLNLDRLVAEDQVAALAAVWEVCRESPVHAEARADFDAQRVRDGGHESPYTVKEVGERPENGWGLVIAMHGGGGAPKSVNDQQWRHMQVFYRDHPEAGGYRYLALRAPNDTWNGFYDVYCWPLVTKLIQGQVLFGDVDPDRVYLIGYSHGGYGAFAIGTRIPDRFAAVHASAAAPTPGITTAENLRNTPFTYMVGEHDTAYGRAERCKAFDAEVSALREANPGAYPVRMEWIEGNGHGGLPDRDKTAELLNHTRVAAPPTLTWWLTDGAVADFSWLTIPEPGSDQRVEARADRAENRVMITDEGVGELWLWLDARLVDPSKPVTVVRGDSESEHTLRPSLAALCESLARRGDPSLAFASKVVLPGD